MIIKQSIFILSIAMALLYFQVAQATTLISEFGSNGVSSDKPEIQPNVSSFPQTYGQDALGPLNIRSLSPVKSLRLSPLPRSPYGLPEGQIELQFNITVANVFVSTFEFLMDFEFTDTRLAINHGFANNWSAEISFNERYIVNAHLDQIRTNFHTLFGIENNSAREKNNTVISIPGLGIDLGSELRGKKSQSIDLSIQEILITESASWPALAMNINMSYITLSSDLIESGKIDAGIQFSVAKKQASGYVYGNMSFTHFNTDESLGLSLKQQQFTGMLGYEYSVSDNQSFILQYLLSEGVVNNLNDLGDYSHEIHIGYKWRKKYNLWELGIVENIINSNNSPDFAFTFGLAHKF